MERGESNSAREAERLVAIAREAARRQAEREFFLVAGEVFVRPTGSEVRDFGKAVGLCLQARRCEVVSPYESGNGAAVYGVGEREWVQVPRIGTVFPDDVALFRHLWPELFKDDPKPAPPAEGATA